MNKVRVSMPEELAAKIDALVGRRGRSAFVEEAVANEVWRRRLLAFLESGEPAWKDEDHPELVEKGTAAWVREMRRVGCSD